uniref:Alpha-crystallin domain-containing protein 22.3 n=1 Tax=Tanacetum cinerariifolium TaxID=118510 RepID=A0A6L2LU59_TANCI|nr:alpha-crystallin domain-containing protein 22.3 [Tanacetum cinerariifolium]
MAQQSEVNFFLKNQPSMIFVPQTANIELHDILAVAKHGVALSGSAAKTIGTLIGSIEILESDEGILFRVAFPCVKKHESTYHTIINLSRCSLSLIEKQCPSGYIWKPKVKNDNALASDSSPLDDKSRDLVQGNVKIKKVYYVKGLNHNLFFVGQLCDADLEVAFRKSTCFVRDLQGNDLLTDKINTSLQELELLFSPMYEEYFKEGNKSVSKSSDLSNNLQQYDTPPTLNVQPTLEPISPPTDANAEGNNTNQAEAAPFEAYEFINPFAPSGTEAAESSSCNIDTSNIDFTKDTILTTIKLKTIL